MVGGEFEALKDDCLDVSEYTDILADGDYRFIGTSNYEQLYPAKKLIPLGFNGTVVYVNNALVQDYDIDSKLDKQVFTNIDQLEAMDKYTGEDKTAITSFSKGKAAKVRVWGVDESAYGPVVSLYGGDTLVGEDMEISLGDETAHVVEALKKSYQSNQFNSQVPVSDYFYFGQLAYLVGDTSIFESVNNYMGGNFAVRPLCLGDKCVVSLENEIALNADLDDNKKILARALIEHLLSDDGQAYMGVIIGNSMPLLEKRLTEYATGNENYKFFTTGYKDALVIGEKGFIGDKMAKQLYTNCYVGEQRVKDNKKLQPITLEETTQTTTESVATPAMPDLATQKPQPATMKEPATETTSIRLKYTGLPKLVTKSS